MSINQEEIANMTKNNKNIIIGISAFYHDSSASLIIDGNIIAAVQEERFTRVKNDSNFPINSINFFCDNFNIKLSTISAIAYYEKPLLKFERILETLHKNIPFGLKGCLLYTSPSPRD